MVGRANCVIALRSAGVSLVLDVSAGQLPAIIHWGADLGTLEVADVQALILSNVDPGGPNGTITGLLARLSAKIELS